MKDMATNTRDKPSQIFAQVVSQCDDNVQALLPREENRKRTIGYQCLTPPLPATYADNLGKDLVGFVSGVGCHVFHGISVF
jgi:hypothetical protein